jgi:tRNA threonylcarbamoyladenosine biosynthesis protein TsaE
LAILESLVETWNAEAACSASAQQLATRPALGDALIELQGDLGAGKTTFVRHLLYALGITGTIKSPTYALMESYVLPSAMSISHFDFYRFNDPQEWEDAGFRDIFAAPGLKLMEWPDMARDLLPVPDLQLTLVALSENVRQVRWDALTPRGLALLPKASA